VVNVTVMVL